MLDEIKNLFGFAPATDYPTLMKEGGIIVDVRTDCEFQMGNIPGTLNIPLDALGNNLDKFKNKDTPIIACCASGMRSETAATLLRDNGYTNVHNGGGWVSLNAKLKRGNGLYEV